MAKGFFFGLGIKGVNERVLRLLLEYSSSSPIPSISSLELAGGGDGGEGNKGRGGEGKRDIDGGMILLQDYFEVPGGLTELMIAWNFQ